LTHPIGKTRKQLLDVGKDGVGVLIAVDGDVVGKVGKYGSGNSGIGSQTVADHIRSIVGTSGEGGGTVVASAVLAWRMLEEVVDATALRTNSTSAEAFDDGVVRDVEVP